ncbi:MAG: hypothetical protein J2P17_25410, partial [Mycobacterium sp.]|nr:hypothetical protein [Mycobacterium sp.]
MAFFACDGTQVTDIDFVELRCGNAIALSYLLCAGLGFSPFAERNPVVDTTVSYLCRILRQGHLNIAVTSAALPPADTSPCPPDDSTTGSAAAHIAASVNILGDTISDIAFTVSDVESAFARAIAHGAHPVASPATRRDGNGEIRRARVSAPGHAGEHLVHTLIERSNYHGHWAPGYQPINNPRHAELQPPSDLGVTHLHEVILDVPTGTGESCAAGYARQFGFDIQTLDPTTRGAPTWLVSGPAPQITIIILESALRSRCTTPGNAEPEEKRAPSGPTVGAISLAVRDIAHTDHQLTRRHLQHTGQTTYPATAASPSRENREQPYALTRTRSHRTGQPGCRISTAPLSPRSN